MSDCEIYGIGSQLHNVFFFKIEKHEQYLYNFLCDLFFSFRMEEGGGGSELSLKIKFEKTLWNCDLIPYCSAG